MLDIELIKVVDIEADASRFQFRSVEFDEVRVQWLVDNWNSDVVDPLDVWRSPDGRMVLLSGHHRREAAYRQGIEALGCRVHDLTLEEAQTFALKSNANRLEYADYEWSRCIAFLMDRGYDFAQAANELSLSVSVTRKLYYLRHLVGTEWERQHEEYQLWSWAALVGQLCEDEIKAERPLQRSELNSILKVALENEMTSKQFTQLIKDLKRARAKAIVGKQETGTLFNIEEFTDRIIRVVRERTHLDSCAVQSWWLYELVLKEGGHDFPIEMRTEMTTVLKRFHAYCLGSEDVTATPTKGKRKVRTDKPAAEKKAS